MRLKILCMAGLGFAAIGCGGAGSESAIAGASASLATSAADHLGPYGVGVVSLNMDDIFTALEPLPAEVPSGHRPMEVEVWYPSSVTPPAGRDHLSGFDGMEVRGAPILNGVEPFPLVVFSHGLGGFRRQNIFQVQYLASHGYVVAAPDHQLSMTADVIRDESTKAATSAVWRPFEVSAVVEGIDRLASDPESMFYRRVDVQQLGMTGHSFGGNTSLAYGGATADFDEAIRFCEKPRNEGFQCRIALKYRDVGAGGKHRVHDERLKAIIPMTAGGTFAFGVTGVATIAVPTLNMSGGQDDIAEADVYQTWIFDALNVPKANIVVEDGGHFSFTQLCPLIPVSDVCGPGKSLSRAIEIADMIDTMTVAFFGTYVRQRPEVYRTYLEKDVFDRRWRNMTYRYEP